MIVRLIRRIAGRRSTWWLAAAMSGLTLISVPLGWSTLAWAEKLEADGRLLPGTSVAGVDVGGDALAAAQRAVSQAVATDRDRPRALVHGDDEWSVRPRQLGADRDVDAALRRARERAVEASLVELVRARWFATEPVFAVEAPLEVPQTAIAEFVADVADEIDRAPRDAAVAWTGDRAELVTDEPGYRVDRGAAAQVLTDELAASEPAADPATVPVETVTAGIAADDLEPVFDEVAAAAERVAGHTVTLTHDDEWRVRPADLDATPDMDALVAAARDGAPTGGEDVLAVPEESMTAFVDGLADDIDRQARDAQLDYTDGWVDIVASRSGRELDRDAAAGVITDAFADGADEVELPVEAVEPDRVAGDYAHVLLVRQGERRLYHYVDGEIEREWPVAVGGGGSPTPTGEFTVGRKRHRPSWYNPAPDGWGADMPEVIGPGRTNPLGLRALNWNRGGGDTLIRFHGTAAVSSIGQAASQGCVRLVNDDVVELYERVPSGATIVSI